MNFKDLEKSLVDDLHLIIFDHDELVMAACHTKQFIVHVYFVSFGEGRVDEGDEDVMKKMMMTVVGLI